MSYVGVNEQFIIGVICLVLILPLLALLIGLALWLTVGRRTPRPPTPVPASAPLDILRERYARGDLSKEQFDQMKRDLEES